MTRVFEEAEYTIECSAVSDAGIEGPLAKGPGTKNMPSQVPSFAHPQALP